MKLEKPGSELSWTWHAKEKMKFYRLSEARLRRVLRRPERVEKGVAPGTTALMQRTGTKKHITEIWLMYQSLGEEKQKKRIITAWRYPGISPVREEIPIPEDIRREILK